MKSLSRFSFLWVILSVLLSGCQSMQNFEAAIPTNLPILPTYTRVVLNTNTPEPTATPTPQPSPSATPTATITLTPTETPYVCQQEQGQVTRHEAGDPNDPDQPPLTYTIYTPPCFAEIPDATYPVLYIIHGQSFGDDQWDRLGMDEAANRLITSGEAPPFLIVMPLEENTWPDPFETRFGFRMADELVPWIDQHYPTCTERSCRAIGGLSRGGGWAVHIGFTRWQLFGAIGAHSTPVFLSDPYRIPIWLEEITREQWPRIYVDIGDRDMYFKYASDFNDLLTRLDVPHEYNIFEGAHDEEYWSQHVEDYLRWYTSPWLEKFDSNSNNSP